MKRKLRLVLLFSIISTTFLAQQFPVNIVPRINAPAPVNFYNYADETSLNSPITVQIFLNDLTVSSRQIRLKIYFEGGNINFSSRDFVVGAEDLFLEGGIPLTLGINELAPYYRLENIQGTNSAVYGQSIPEGSYNFCFEVYDFISGAKLTTKTCAPVFIFKNEPPILNIPFNGTNIEPKDFENIVFQWTPRHINVSNVEYDFSIVEIWDDSVDPQTAFLSQAPIYETTTRNTSIFYGPDKPLLLPEKRYAWRVQAKALQGIEEIGLFKNQGFSEVFWFSKIAPCQVPEGVTAEAKGTSKINIFWDQDPTLHSEYIIAYREANNPDANWFTKRTNSSWATIWDLKPGTTYEYKIKGKCIYQFSEYSELQNITTDIIQNEDANYNCGIVPDAVAISNRDPHPGLNIGDQVTAGDFKVTITEIQSQSNGIISGKGFVAIPYLKFAKFGVTFSNILVNTNKQLAEGEIVTLYDPEFGEGASMTVDVNINISEGITGDAGGEPEIIKVDFVVDTVEIDANGAIVVTGTNGETAIIPGGDDVKIVSENGDIWSVDENGNITEEEGAAGGAVTDASTNGLGADGSVNEITASGVSVVFEKSGYYHFDELPEGTSDTFEKEYKILEAKSGKYRVPYKSISDNKGEDFITATVNITDTTIIKDSIIFKTKDGAKVLIDSWDGNVAKLKLKRKFDYADEEIFAVIKSKDNNKYDIAGSIITTHLASEKLEPINITLVPVFKDENNKDIKAELDKIKEGVEEIYAKAGVVLNIQNVNNISPEEIYEWDKDKDTRVKVGERSVLSTYTEEESVFNKHIKQQTYYNKKTYYVFVTELQASNSEVDGFMPLNRQFGFVFNANVNSIQKQVRTMAHELGHGIFALEHTWDEYKFAQGATNNLMDYGNGTVLNHLDWKKIHASGIKFYLFQNAQDGEYSNAEYFVKTLQLIRCAYTSGATEMAMPEKYKNEEDKTAVAGFDYGLPTPKSEINGQKIRSAWWTVKSNENTITNIQNPTIDPNKGDIIFGNFKIDLPVASYSWNNGVTPFEHFKNYLLPSKEDVKKDYETVINQLVGKDKFTDDDIRKLKSIASCGSKHFSTKNKFTIIKIIANHNYALTEYYEDLILDLMETYEGDVITYSEELLAYLEEDVALTRKLFNRMTDEHGGYLWRGNENNFTRFLKVMFGLWKETKYAKKEKYTYVEVGDYIGGKIVLSPETIIYDGESWWPKLSFTNVRYRENKIHLDTKSKYGKLGEWKYDIFQPVLLIFEKGKNKGKATKTEVPAIFFAGTTEKDNIEKSLDQIGLTVDVVLTFTGVGNFTKLRHLTKLQKVGRIVLGTVEITSGVADILMNYTTICEGNEEFCNSLREYNMYLQMGLLGSGLVRAKFKAARDKAKKEYLKNRDALIKKKGVDDPTIKELDGHFKINTPNGLLSRLDNLELNDLKSKINKLDKATQTKFFDDFQEISDWGLKKMNSNPSLLSHWKKNAEYYKKQRKYHNVKHLDWSSSADKLRAEGGINKKLVDKIDHELNPLIHDQVTVNRKFESLGESPGTFDASIVASGSSNNSDIIISYNRKKYDNVKLEANDEAYESFVNNELDPFLKKQVEYMDFIRKDFTVGNGNLYKKLYGNGVSQKKLLLMQRPGIHAETLTLNSLIKGKNVSSIDDIKALKIKIIVKGKNHGHMATCPHCFILTHGVEMINIK